MKTFYETGLRFACRQCSSCCRHESGYVYISASDLVKLLDWFKISRQDFIRLYCRWVEIPDGRRLLCLKEKSNYDCIFWNDGCAAYSVRPIQCSTFPFWQRNLCDCEAWAEAAKKCPGINNGTFFDHDRIDCLLDRYRQNTPLTREEFLKSE